MPLARSKEPPVISEVIPPQKHSNTEFFPRGTDAGRPNTNMRRVGIVTSGVCPLHFRLPPNRPSWRNQYRWQPTFSLSRVILSELSKNLCDNVLGRKCADARIRRFMEDHTLLPADKGISKRLRTIRRRGSFRGRDPFVFCRWGGAK